MADSVEDFKTLVTDGYTVSRKFGLKINKGKTDVKMVTKEIKPTSIYTGEEKFPTTRDRLCSRVWGHIPEVFTCYDIRGFAAFLGLIIKISRVRYAFRGLMRQNRKNGYFFSQKSLNYTYFWGKIP